MAKQGIIPIIDLFAGPGGLGEGFSSFYEGRKRPFKIALSVEKDPQAWKTLKLRAFFRQFDPGNIPDDYWSYCKGNLDWTDLSKLFPREIKAAESEARCFELGVGENSEVDRWVEEGIRRAPHGQWVLIGGPPCQAYSVIGRSRMKGRTGKDFNSDHRHFLYREYLRIIRKFKPSVFVMENVRGILTSKVDGRKIFPQIRRDLQGIMGGCEGNGGGQSNEMEYKVFSLSEPPVGTGSPDGHNFLIKAEEYGIPQARHRVILLGVRADFWPSYSLFRLKQQSSVSVEDVLSGLPPLRSCLSREADTREAWKDNLRDIGVEKWFGQVQDHALRSLMEKELKILLSRDLDPGGRYIDGAGKPRKYGDWYRADGPPCGIVFNHEARSHMNSDIHRYFYVSCFGKHSGVSPRLSQFPEALLPDHKNVEDALNWGNFNDRFRVQVGGCPATTITSHIHKDGHYFIHPDPSQCRSLTVREAARIQTFPDSYFFEGNRTSQYQQVGNAVPPLLARQIAESVYKILKENRGR